MSKETGGPAFPQSAFWTDSDKPYVSVDFGGGGMTLRDHFAGLAMQAIVRRYDGHPFGGGTESPQYRELAEDAYKIAFAMLRARGE